MPPKRNRISSVKSSPPQTPQTVTIPELKTPVPDLLEHTTNSAPSKLIEEKPEADFNPNDKDLMEDVDISKFMVLKKGEEDGPEIKGGAIDALIIQATKATKNGGLYRCYIHNKYKHIHLIQNNLPIKLATNSSTFWLHIIIFAINKYTPKIHL